MGLDALGSLGMLAGRDPAELRRLDRDRAAEVFEEVLAEQLVGELRKAMPEGAMGGGAWEMFGGLMDRELAAAIARCGDLGVAAQLRRRWGETAAPAAAVGGAMPRISGARRDGGRWLRPLVGRITSAFGWRRDPITGHRRKHDGVDIAAPEGTPIAAVAAGTVRRAGWAGGYGKVVEIAHDDGTTTLYAHCRDTRVEPGQRVAAGTVIGEVGSTGRSTGPHLHLEVRRDGVPVDPSGWVDLGPAASSDGRADPKGR